VRYSNPDQPVDTTGLHVALFSDENESWPKFLATRHTMTCRQQLESSKKFLPLAGPDYIAIHQESRV
jgi:hypothetical protein